MKGQDYTELKDSYILFSITQMVIAVQKGTHFNFANTNDKDACLDQSSVMGIWTSKIDKKLKYDDYNKKGIYKIIATVDAEVVITTDIYDNFVGQLATIQSGTDEWSLFVGVPGMSYEDDVTKDEKATIEAVAKSFMPYTNPNPEPTYAVIAGDETLPNNGEDFLNSTEPSTEEMSEGETTESEPETEQEGSAVETSETSAESSEISTDSSEIPAESSEIPEETSETEEETAAQRETRPANGEMVGLTLNNQRKAIISKDGIIDSSVFSFLDIGQTGSINAIEDGTGNTLEMAAKLRKVYKGTEAIQMIQDFCASGKAGYEYTDPPVGTLWQVAESDLFIFNELEEMPYVDSRIVGVDGNLLKHAGITYTSRTYDMNWKATDDFKGYMFYYAVPANCHEYVLSIGAGKNKNGYKSAYYLINDKTLAAAEEAALLEAQKAAEEAAKAAETTENTENTEELTAAVEETATESEASDGKK